MDAEFNSRSAYRVTLARGIMREASGRTVVAIETKSGSRYRLVAAGTADADALTPAYVDAGRPGEPRLLGMCGERYVRTSPIVALILSDGQQISARLVDFSHDYPRDRDQVAGQARPSQLL